MNLNMLRELPNPDAIKALLPTTPQLDAIKARRDQEIRDILSGKDDKFLLIIGPCSADRQDAVLDYIVQLVCSTRSHALITLAASPRASLALMRAACASAMLEGRTYVIPRDVNEMYDAILSHRIMLAPEAKIERMSPSDILAALKETVKAPIVK